jgi:hypothetical protein
METPVILILVGVFAIILTAQLIVFKKYLNQRRIDLKQHKLN